MQFESASAVPAGSCLTTDVCVIGAGAAGITLAWALSGSNRDVLLLEAGGLRPDPALEARAFDVTQKGLPLLNPLPNRARWFGGSTNLWAGRISKPSRIDFESRAWVAASGWPFGLDHLEPYLTRAGELLDVPNFRQIDLAAWEPNPTINTFARGETTTLGVFLWANGMRMGDRNSAVLGSAPNVRVLTNATATELVENEAGTAIESIRVAGPDGSRFSIAANTFVVAGGPIENARLMLASNARSPEGVGNQYDQVGRYYMDHPRGEGLASVDLRPLSPAQIERLALLGQKTKTRYGDVQLHVVFSEQMQQDEALLNSALHAHLSFGIPQRGHASARRLLRRLRGKSAGRGPGIGADLRNLAESSPQIARYAWRRIAHGGRPIELVVIDQMEQEPDPNSRLTVNRDRLDPFGIPHAEITWRIGESTYRTQRRMHEVFRDALRAQGIDTFRSEVLDREPGDVVLWDMKHPSGTTRMSASPRDGVVDASGRVHGTMNLYVSGSSVFPTVGYFNPVLTIVALALRLADELKASPA